MCGIAGLFLKDPALEPELGRMTAAMLAVLSDRGPDSAGFAVYGTGTAGVTKLTVRLHDPSRAHATIARLAVLGPDITIERRDDHLLLNLPQEQADGFVILLRKEFPDLALVGSGSRMELYKGVGLPAEVGRRFGLASMAGTHAIGHTRMATESAVTIAGAHPFTTGTDQCLVHNGSLSNHNDMRRRLRRHGLSFETANDSEVAAGYLSWRMAQGARLDEALYGATADLDGFYTFVVGTETGFAVLRDPVACKPAVMAETARWVAFGSEYRALVDLPDIEDARVFEPEPAQVYFWERAA